MQSLLFGGLTSDLDSYDVATPAVVVVAFLAGYCPRDARPWSSGPSPIQAGSTAFALHPSGT